MIAFCFKKKQQKTPVPDACSQCEDEKWGEEEQEEEDKSVTNPSIVQPQSLATPQGRPDKSRDTCNHHRLIGFL